jgi:IS5 family transposase
MERKLADPTLTDALMLDYGSPRMAAFFTQMNTVIPWEELAGRIANLYDDSGAAQAKGGRPHWPLTMMVKCLLLQKWFGLSDPGLEEMLRDRLSFRRFVGLSLDDATPDETTFVRFRARLAERGHGSTLFDAVKHLLEERGILLNQGTLIDASVQQTSYGRWSRASDEKADLHTRDRSASSTRMYGRTYFGFKGHIAPDTQGLVKDYRFDTAATHESKYFNALTRHETVAVWADKGYFAYDRIAQLRLRGVFAGIAHRRGRDQPPLSAQQKRHNHRVAQVRFVVEHPFAWMKARGWGRARYRGVARNGLDFALNLLAWNLHRARDLLLAGRMLAGA